MPEPPNEYLAPGSIFGNTNVSEAAPKTVSGPELGYAAGAACPTAIDPTASTVAPIAATSAIALAVADFNTVCLLSPRCARNRAPY